MRTLNQIKTEVAQGHGYGTFYETGLDTDMIDDIAKLYAQSAIDEIKEKQQALDKTASDFIMQIRVKSAIALRDDSNEIDQMLYDLEYKIGLITDMKLELK